MAGAMRGRRPSTKVMPSDADLQMVKKLGVEQSRWNLRFRHNQLEEAFTQHYTTYVARKMRRLVAAYGVVELLYGLVELPLRVCEPSQLESQLIVRGAMCALCLVVYANPRNVMQHKHALVAIFNVFSGLLLLLHALAAREEPQWYMFARGTVSVADSLTFIIVCLSGSGLMTPHAAATAWLHAIASLVLQAIFFGASSLLKIRCVALLFICFLCTLSAYHVERDMRENFLMRCVISEDRTRRDTLIHAMLPSEIVTALKTEQHDNLSRRHGDVAVLFCIISNFAENSVDTTARELVVMLSKIFEAFDRATELHGATKIENVADTYMVASGCPRYDPFQAVKIAELALSMLGLVREFNWRWASRQPVQVQIGIHIGDVVGGVVGHKTYAYHLFGDTVNTSSRMCTHGAPGRIHLSERAHELLMQQSNKFLTHARGMISVKGKGGMATFWLNDCIDPGYKHVVLQVLAEADQPMQLRFNAELPSASDPSLLELVSVTRWTLNYTFPAASTSFAQADVLAGYTPTIALSSEEEEFLQELEASFLEAHTTKSSTAICHVLIFAATISVVTVIACNIRAWSDVQEVWLLVSAVLATSVLAVIGAAYVHRRASDRRNQVVGCLCCFLVCVGHLPALFIVEGPDLLPLMVSGLVALGLLMEVRFVFSLSAGSALVAAYVVTTTITTPRWRGLVAIGVHACIILALVVSGSYRRERNIRRDFIHLCLLHDEHAACEELIRNMLPVGSHAEQLLQGNLILDELENVTVLYADIVGFTPLCAQIPPEELYQLLHTVYSAFDSHLDAFGLYKVETIGDTFIVIGGLPGYRSSGDHAFAVLMYAFHMLQELEIIRASHGIHVKIRVGIHTGKVAGSVPSLQNPRYLLWGSCAVTAPALEGTCPVGAVHLSYETYSALPLNKVQNLGITLREQPSHSKTEKLTSKTFTATCDNISAFFKHPSKFRRPTIMTRSFLGHSSSSSSIGLRSPKMLKVLEAIEKSVISRWWRFLFPTEGPERTFGCYEVQPNVQVLDSPKSQRARERFASAFSEAM